MAGGRGRAASRRVGDRNAAVTADAADRSANGVRVLTALNWKAAAGTEGQGGQGVGEGEGDVSDCGSSDASSLASPRRGRAPGCGLPPARPEHVGGCSYRFEPLCADPIHRAPRDLSDWFMSRMHRVIDPSCAFGTNPGGHAWEDSVPALTVGSAHRLHLESSPRLDAARCRFVHSVAAPAARLSERA